MYKYTNVWILLITKSVHEHLGHPSLVNMALVPCSKCLYCGIHHPLKRDHKEIGAFSVSLLFFVLCLWSIKIQKCSLLYFLPSAINVFVNENHPLPGCLYGCHFVCIFIINIIFLLSNPWTVVFMPQKNLCVFFISHKWQPPSGICLTLAFFQICKTILTFQVPRSCIFKSMSLLATKMVSLGRFDVKIPYYF